MTTFEHVSVLLKESVDMLNPKPGGVYLDCTLGGGGHGAAILEMSTPGGILVGIDRDRAAIDAASERLAPYRDRTALILDNYINFKVHLQAMGIEGIDGVIFDLGVSSHQLDEGQRGFSYRYDAPLDMRMSQDAQVTAAHIVNNSSEEELKEIIWEYGEERWASRIAAFIVAEREKSPIERTGQLVDIIKAAIPKGARRDGPHPARRTFQALRIATNDELGGFQRALKEVIPILKPGGRVCIITFHSLEDRIAKETLRSFTGRCSCPPEIPDCVCGRKKMLEILTKKPILPSAEEIEGNPRARSAKLRAAERCRE